MKRLNSFLVGGFNLKTTSQIGSFPQGRKSKIISNHRSFLLSHHEAFKRFASFTRWRSLRRPSDRKQETWQCFVAVVENGFVDSFLLNWKIDSKKKRQKQMLGNLGKKRFFVGGIYYMELSPWRQHSTGFGTQHQWVSTSKGISLCKELATYQAHLRTNHVTPWMSQANSPHLQLKLIDDTSLHSLRCDQNFPQPGIEFWNTFLHATRNSVDKQVDFGPSFLILKQFARLWFAPAGMQEAFWTLSVAMYRGPLAAHKLFSPTSVQKLGIEFIRTASLE